MKNIALALSGGGFRAAAFSLGSLSYLDHLQLGNSPLLTMVKFIGSTSGGSIASLAYATGKCDNLPFNTIFTKLLDALEGEDLIRKAFEILGDDSFWSTHPVKSRNLINAFSLAYNEKLFAERQFNYLNTCLPQTHLEQICVNSTELANGLSFRFQSQHPDKTLGSGRIGNGYIHFKPTAAATFGKLRLADILAASSCFPGGFEPIIFPEDFTHPQLAADELNASINYKDNPFSSDHNPEDLFKDIAFKNNKARFALLDGGIADNQAIDSILKANDRRLANKRQPFDLIIVCDVTSHLMDGFTLPVVKDSFSKHFSVSLVRNALLVLAGLFPLALTGLFFHSSKPYALIALIPSLIAFAGYLYLQRAAESARQSAHQSKSTWGIIFFRYVKYFTRLRLNFLGQMLTARLKSVFLITSDVYLKQIRAHYYRLVFKDPKLRDLIVANAIYDLSLAKEPMPDAAMPKGGQMLGMIPGELDAIIEAISNPSSIIRTTAEKARLVATTLWFDENSRSNDEKAAIVATGQFTLCFNLIKHLIGVRKQTDVDHAETEFEKPEQSVESFDEDKAILLRELVRDWEQFNKNPFWLYQQKLNASR